jgi:hypothetical protein
MILIKQEIPLQLYFPLFKRPPMKVARNNTRYLLTINTQQLSKNVVAEKYPLVYTTHMYHQQHLCNHLRPADYKVPQ